MEDSDVLAGLPDEDSLFDLAELFKVFGDSTRIKILFVLLKNSMAVNTIAEALNMTQSAVSHQLRILKTNGLVKYERNGKSLIYSLADDHVTSILNQGLDHIVDIYEQPAGDDTKYIGTCNLTPHKFDLTKYLTEKFAKDYTELQTK